MLWLATLLRSLADKLGGESDADLRARMLGIVRGRAPSGNRDSIESAIHDALPFARTAECSWHKRNGDEVLMVRFR
jgi:hypothetical protein